MLRCCSKLASIPKYDNAIVVMTTTCSFTMGSIVCLDNVKCTKLKIFPVLWSGGMYLFPANVKVLTFWCGEVKQVIETFSSHVWQWNTLSFLIRKHFQNRIKIINKNTSWDKCQLLSFCFLLKYIYFFPACTPHLISHVKSFHFLLCSMSLQDEGSPKFPVLCSS